MTIHKHQQKTTQQRKNDTSGPIYASGISSIPFEATPQDIFRLTVDVEQVFERETKTGSPYFFLSCRDEEGMTFSVVVWDSQWARIQGRMKEGANVEINIRVPNEGYSAFNLA
jgi:DNA polymerase III alpha subunit